MLAIYCRISGDKEEGKDRSLTYQEKIGRELAKELGLIPKVYIDEGISGTLPIDKRPAFFQMLQDITKKDSKITTVYGYNTSRLYRNDNVRIQFLSIIRKHKIKVYYEKKEFDWLDPQSKFLDAILAATNELSVDLTKANVKGVLHSNLLEGKAQGIFAYGYTKDDKGFLVIHEEEAKVVRMVYKLSLDGMRARPITEYLTEHNIPTRYNTLKGEFESTNSYNKVTVKKSKKDAKWSHSVIRHMLRNECYKGIRKWGDETYKSPVIIEPDVWDSVQRDLNSRNTKTGKSTQHKFLLNNILYCNKCGKRYTGRSVLTRPNNYYQCTSKLTKRNCGNRGISQPKIEWFVWNKFFMDKKLLELVKEWFKNTDIKDKVDELNKVVSKYQKKLKHLDKQRINAVAAVMDGTFYKHEIKGEMNKIRADKETIQYKLDNLKEELNQYTNSTNNITSVEEDLDKINEDTPYNQKQVFIKKWIKGIHVDYSIDIANNKGYYSLEFKFNIPNMRDEVYFIHRSYKDIEKAISIGYYADGEGE